MPQVWISVGSNQARATSLRAAMALLRERYGALHLSTVYESAAVGFTGDAFYNLVVGFMTVLPAEILVRELRAIENACGRVRSTNKFAPRTLDLDLLTWGERVCQQPGLILPHEEILQHAFVLCPLAEVAGTTCHPQLGRSYRDLWQAFDQLSQPLWPVNLDLY